MKSSTSRRRRQFQDGNIRLQRIFLSLTAAFMILALAPHGAPLDFRWLKTADVFSPGGIVALIGLALLAWLVVVAAMRWIDGIARRPATSRRSLIDVGLAGGVCLLLIAQVLGGVASALNGGGIQSTHVASACLLIALPVVFMLVEYIHGQIALILRVASPGPLANMPRAPRLTDLMRIHLPGVHVPSRKSKAHVAPIPAHVHRLALLIVTAVTAVILAISIRPDGALPDIRTAGVQSSAPR